MRASVAVFMAISILFVGVFAISESAQDAQGPAVANGTDATASAYNTSEGVFEGVAQVSSDAVVWVGIAAVIVVALGLLYMASQSGRR